MQHTDFIIVGSGLAGITLAHTLQAAGKKCIIISEPTLSASSKVAAGVFNPVVFYRITKSYMADLVLPYARSYYDQIEKLLQLNLIEEHSIAKVFSSIEEQRLWELRREEGVGIYLGDQISDETTYEFFHSNLGFGKVLQTGALNCELYLEASINFFQDNFESQKFDYNKIVFEGNRVIYDGIAAEKIIFCEGHLISQNPFFKEMLLKPVKGEIITIRFEQPIPESIKDYILSRKCYLLPIGNNCYKVGATYNWNELNDETTMEGLTALLLHIKEITNTPFTVLSHQAGVRPAAPDRRPILGSHPLHKQVAVFNGLGTKGVMLAPYFANELFEHLCNGKELHKEVSIMRYYQKTNE